MAVLSPVHRCHGLLFVAGGFPTWEGSPAYSGAHRWRADCGAHPGNFVGARAVRTVVLPEIRASRGRDVFVRESATFWPDRRKSQRIPRCWLPNSSPVPPSSPPAVIVVRSRAGLADTLGCRPTGSSAADALDRPVTDRVSIIKLHGDIKTPDAAYSAKSQYDDAYGNDVESVDRQMPKLLEYYTEQQSLLFWVAV